MAPNLEPSQRALIRDMVLHHTHLTIKQMAAAAGCSKQAIISIRNNLRRYGTIHPPPKGSGAGRPRTVTPAMREALCQRLIERPHASHEELLVFLWDDFHTLISPSSVSRALIDIEWTRQAGLRAARERSAPLRQAYLQELSRFHPAQLVFVDESGCDRRVGFRRTYWSPCGYRPKAFTQWPTAKRYQMLLAYGQDGVIFSRVFTAAESETDEMVFEAFVESLLPHCEEWPGPRSVLAMDGASFHHTERVMKMCIDAGVRVLCLPPCSPDLNPVEDLMTEVKAVVRRRWSSYDRPKNQRFDEFLASCLREADVKGPLGGKFHFLNTGPPQEEGVSTQQRARRTTLQECVDDTWTENGQPMRREKESTTEDDSSEIDSTSSGNELNEGTTHESSGNDRTQRGRRERHSL